MTRARIVAEDPWQIIRHHSFENFPDGLSPHTTAPLDYLIVGFKWTLDALFRLPHSGGGSVLRGNTLDVAGAIISPCLGMLTCLWIGIWARFAMHRGSRTGSTPLQPFWAAAPLLFAISPILTHGNALGRPDHQSLLLALLAVALGAEYRQAFGSSCRWALTSGAAWGVALWVSLYEPLVLLAATTLIWLVCAPRRFFERERLPGLVLLVAIAVVALLVEGWRIKPPAGEMLGFLSNWNRTIGELGHLDVREPTLYRWVGWGIIAAPIALLFTARRDRRMVPLLAMLVIVFGLTCWQLRWGYFLALVFAMSLPWQLMVWRKAWAAWPLFIVSLWPLLQDWDARLFPDAEAQKRRAQERLELAQLRSLCEALRELPAAGFIAPWWLSPSIAYWSGHSGVAGSSHESLPGIIDTARFYLTADATEAARIVEKRKVAWMLADDPSRVIHNSSVLLAAEPPGEPLAQTLAEHPRDAPEFLAEWTTPRPRRDTTPDVNAPAVAAMPRPVEIVEQRFYRIYFVQGAKLPE